MSGKELDCIAARADRARMHEEALRRLTSSKWVLEAKEIETIHWHYRRSLDWWFTSIFGFLEGSDRVNF